LAVARRTQVRKRAEGDAAPPDHVSDTWVAEYANLLLALEAIPGLEVIDVARVTAQLRRPIGQLLE